MPREKSQLELVPRTVRLTKQVDKKINELVKAMQDFEQRQVSRGEIICRAIDEYSKPRG
jgi:predicted transglutaminase-like cysteine proteinase